MYRDERHSLDRRLHDLLGKIVCTDVACDRDRFSTRSLDLLHDRSRLVRIDTASVSATVQLFRRDPSILADDDFGSLLGKQQRCTPADALCDRTWC